METGAQREVCVGGFEKDRKKHGTLKKLCPAKQYGIECKYMNKYQETLMSNLKIPLVI